MLLIGLPVDQLKAALALSAWHRIVSCNKPLSLTDITSGKEVMDPPTVRQGPPGRLRESLWPKVARQQLSSNRGGVFILLVVLTLWSLIHMYTILL